MRWIGWFVSLLWLCHFPVVYGATSKACVQKYRQKKYEAAGRCFWDAANKMGDLSKAPAMKKYSKGRLLRNAAQSYIKAAKQSSGLQASGHYENTLKILYQYANEKLYESQARKRSLEQRIKKLLRQTGFTSLQITANHPKAKICIASKGKQDCVVGAQRKKLLPAGTYTLLVSYPDGTTRRRPAKMQAGLQLALDFYPPTTHAQVKLLSQHPSAQMTLSGATLAKPLTQQGASWQLKLKPGTYNLKLKYPGVPALTRPVVVGVQPEQTFTFRPPSSTLQVNSTPDAAMVYIDGAYRGRTPIQLLVPEGNLKIELRKGCHTIYKTEITLKPQERKEINGTLVPEKQYTDWLGAQRSASTKRALGWVGLLGGIAVFGLTTASFVLSSQARDKANEQRDLYLGSRDTPEQYLSAYQSAANDNNTWQTIGYVSAGAGGVAVALGLAGLLASAPKAQDLRCQVPMGQKPGTK